MSVTITEILGTDSIAGSRLTINANFLLLENAYNDLENTFNINVLTGSIDVSTASSGQIKAKSILTNSMVMPSSGSPTVQAYGAGASAGFIIASSTVASATGIFSNVLQTNILNASGAATLGATATFQGQVNNQGSFIMGASGNFVNTNRKAAVGATTAFPTPPGAGVTGTFSNPYVPTLTESVLYIDSNYVSTALADLSNPTGFFLSSSTGSGASASIIPAGFTLTLVDVATSPGMLPAGVTGSSSFYTGFNSTYFTASGVTAGIQTPGVPYVSSLTLMWEPRINQSSITEKGSWIVVNSVGNFVF